MVETIRTAYLGELRTEVMHVKSGYRLITDVPKERGGMGESYSPTYLFCASLVSSILSVLGGVAKSPDFKGSIDGTIVRTTKVMNDKPEMVAEIIMEFDMPKNNFTDEQKKILEASARNSQVGRSVSTTMKQTLIFHY